MASLTDEVVSKIMDLRIDGNEPVPEAVDHAEVFARLLPLDKIYSPSISVEFGEIVFTWDLENFRLYIGFRGDGIYTYYGKTSDEVEYMADHEPFDKPLSNEILDLLRR